MIFKLLINNQPARGWLFNFRRNIFFSLVLLGFYSLGHPLRAQELEDNRIKIGFSAGANYTSTALNKSKLPHGIKFTSSGKPSYSVGLSLLVPFSQKLSFKTGVNYLNFSYQINQESFNNDSLLGNISTQLFIQSFELPVIALVKFPSGNKFLKNTYLGGGFAISYDRYIRFKSQARIMAINPNPDSAFFYSYDINDNIGSLKNSISPSLLIGAGKEFIFRSGKLLQVNFWYAQGLKKQPTASIEYVLLKRNRYPLEIEKTVSNFRLELTYFPWKLR